MEQPNLHNLPSGGCLRRLLAGLYDWLLVIALMMLLSVPAVALMDDAIQPGNLAYRISLILIAAGFFIGFWVYGGQTLGMKAWRLQLISADGKNADFRQAMTRFAAAIVAALPAGLGFFWILWDRQGLSWPDRWSNTRIVQLPKRNGQ